ncbi:Med11p TDEL_0A02120 [Torulaspora delbrueckii]|uniref:Mediator of RNA polymerase II transcription subunit 11 n=1 Tax=Torulaspora delbrueckii TaxID=4950 RepID=G8ZLQ0_TORDE|nr:hypothetical protein TDEL_0A02120 [Torulaspora delbrueckii]CCE89544.1 hypothetical protein TDEL_0A02120 [Torulaspora delbrueckii]
MLNRQSKKYNKPETEMQPQYVQDRLESLAEVDNKLCSLLKTASQIVFTFSELKQGNHELKPQFEQHVKQFYTDLESSTVQLRQEIKLLDENVGTRLLPINVNKKATGQDDDKMREQVAILKDILGENN